MNILKDLNAEQQQAVTSTSQSLLVLAGAGSGKTRVLVHRIAWLMQTYQFSPYAILAVTFTNKAAREMQHRVEDLLQLPAKGMWIGTFHSLAHRLLRTHSLAAKLPEAFQILDSEDQYRLLRRIYKTLNVEEDRWPVKQTQWFINQKKDEGLRAAHLQEGYDVFTRTMCKIYSAYEEACERGGLVDFAELLLRTHELFRDNPDILQHYQERFKHILVDEFQDTNTVQYAWIQQLTGKNGPVTIVGDDDQSIYGWRGAKIENIHRFARDHANTQTIRLERNYRSTETILNAANDLIAHNEDRLGKSLWTQNNPGDPIHLYSAFNEIDEARFVIDRVQSLQQQGHRLRDIALLYRSNAQSRVLEETFIRNNIAYRIYGGLRFFDRAEVKDALSYCRLISNVHDDAAFERIVNTPTRGIGERTVAIVRDYVREHGGSLWQASLAIIEAESLSARASNALKGFITLIESLNTGTQELELYEIIENAIHQSALRDHYRKEKGERGLARIENLDELINASRQFENDNEELSDLTSFLSHAALETGEKQSGPHDDCVQLMTLHSAKGLEFPTVFLCGMEEGLFPHQMSYDEPGRLEEERRLCYVGMTRAMKNLFLTYAECRRLYGKENYRKASRFVREIPEKYLETIRFSRQSIQPAREQSFKKKNFPQKKTYLQTEHDSGLRLGQHVAHKTFGDGVIINFEGQGSEAKVQVKFSDVGTKWLVFQYANLETV